MKNKYLKRFALATLLAIGCTQVANAQVGNAQKRYTLGDGKNYTRVIETNADVTVCQTDEQCITTTFNKTPKKNIKAGATTHTLSVYPPEGVGTWSIYVASGDTYFNQTASFFGGDGLIDEVEEGVYDIVINGSSSVSDTSFFITYDQVVVNEDVTIQSSLVDCCYRVEVCDYTPDGTPLSELNYVRTEYTVLFNWRGQGILVKKDVKPLTTYYGHVPYVYFSGFDERSSIGLTERLFVENQTCYFINHEPIAGCSGNLVFGSNGEDLKTHEEYYYVNTNDTSYYFVDEIVFGQDTDGSKWVEAQFSKSRNTMFDGGRPLTIVSNVKIEDPLDFPHGYHYVMAPHVTETKDWESYIWPEYDNTITTDIMYYNADDELVWEPFHNFKRRFSEFLFNEAYHDEPSLTPMAYHYEVGEKLCFGERTPIVYQQTQAYNAETSPTGAESPLIVNTTIMGENGIQRIGDHDALIHISLDGEEIYCDSIYKYNADYYNHPVVQPGIVTVDITDNHLVVEGVEKTNTTHTEFDLSREDAMPPTMTILQVKNQYGFENVELIDWAEAQIVFAAGDFEPHFVDFGGGMGYFDKMQYKAKPNVEVYYSIENGEWQPLEYTENEELFYVNYGNVFTIGLNQLEANVADKWVNLKFVVTDEAGNSQTQELSNVFYAGEMESVNEHAVNRLQHEVYPNPFNGEVRIMSSEAVNGNATFNVYNVLGAQVYHQDMNCTNTTEFVWDGSQVGPGVYFYSISTVDGVLQGKIVKE